MVDIETIIKAYKFCKNNEGTCDKCTYFPKKSKMYGCPINNDMISAISEQKAEIDRLKAEQPKWIPVEDRLPEKCDFYLVRDFGEIKMNGKKIGLTKVMMFYPEEKQWEKHNEDVTHWMPTPEPPKEGEQE